MADLTTPDLAAALEAKDAAAVAFAIRNGTVTVPLLESPDGSDQVRVFRRDGADKYMLLLFSAPATYAAMLPGEDDPLSRSFDRPALREYLESNLGVLESVWFDVAGPHPMQADPADILAALSI